MLLFLNRLFFILFLLVYTPSFYLYSQESDDSINPESTKASCYGIFSLENILSQVKEEGVFKPITEEDRKKLEQAYWETRNNGFVLPVREDLRHVYREDLDYILPSSIDTHDYLSHWEAIDNFRKSAKKIDPQQNPFHHRILSAYGYEAFADSYFFTSVGGAWARGGSKTIKFEVPLNLVDLVSDKNREILQFSDRIFQAKQDVDILLSFVQSFELCSETVVRDLLGEHDFNYLQQIISTLEKKQIFKDTVTKDHLSEDGLPEDLYGYIHNFALHCKELLADYVSKLISSVKKDSRALNIVDLKIALAAILSEVTHLYFSIDFWTGEHTHQALKDYIYSFKYDPQYNFATKEYSSDPELNELIIAAICKYLQASEELGETFLFGYMELVPPIDNTLSKIDSINQDPLTHWQNQPGVIKNSPGASSFFGYLNVTGRRAELLGRGVRYLLFNNLEVLGPIHKEIDAFRRVSETSNNYYDLAFIVVPKQMGYTGGFPVIDGTGRKLLLEESQVAKEQRENYGFFNTNTGIFKLDKIASVSKIGFEKKEQGRISRPKGNLGDSTDEYISSLIGGEVGENYLNFKGYNDYITNGNNLINNHFLRWASILLQQKNNQSPD